MSGPRGDEPLTGPNGEIPWPPGGPAHYGAPPAPGPYYRVNVDLYERQYLRLTMATAHGAIICAACLETVLGPASGQQFSLGQLVDQLAAHQAVCTRSQMPFGQRGVHYVAPDDPGSGLT